MYGNPYLYTDLNDFTGRKAIFFRVEQIECCVGSRSIPWFLGSQSPHCQLACDGHIDNSALAIVSVHKAPLLPLSPDLGRSRI
jgi:hypothetical protein